MFHIVLLTTLLIYYFFKVYMQPHVEYMDYCLHVFFFLAAAVYEQQGLSGC